MIKLFVTDLDGTLLSKGNVIIEEDKQAIETLVDHGVEFSVATGRMDRDIQKILKSLSQTGHRVSQNGGFVYDKHDNLIHAQTFHGDLSKRLHEAIKDHSHLYCVTTADEAYVSEKTGVIKDMEHLLYFPLKEGVDFIEEYGKSIYPSKFMILGETDAIVKTQEKLSKHFSSETESYLSDAHCVDIVPKGISKAIGLDYLIKALDISSEEIAVIGDSFNDVPMLEMTPHSYAMETAHDDVKGTASKVVHHVHEAIQDLKQQGLIQGSVYGC